jgi:hypothetical protein
VLSGSSSYSSSSWPPEDYLAGSRAAEERALRPAVDTKNIAPDTGTRVDHLAAECTALERTNHVPVAAAERAVAKVAGGCIVGAPGRAA